MCQQRKYTHLRTELRTEILWKDFPAARHTVSGFAQPAIMIEIHGVAVVLA
jgi:hypothetical protein